MEISYEEIKKQAAEACEELVETAKLKAGDPGRGMQFQRDNGTKDRKRF